MRIHTQTATAILAIGLFALGGCGKRKPSHQASVSVIVSADVSDPLTAPSGAAANWFEEQSRLVRSEEVLGRVVDELSLGTKWALPRGEACQRLRDAMFVGPIHVGNESTRVVESYAERAAAVGFAMTVTLKEETEAEQAAGAIARAFKEEAEARGGERIAAQLTRAEAALQAAQETLAGIDVELRTLQTNLYVPSGYRLAAEYEAELQANIRLATNEEAERRAQLEALRRLESEELRAALVKIERARVGLPAVATNVAASTSMLLSNHQALKSAVNELDLARSGALTESNAVAHAELKLEQANRNLADTMSAYLKSLEIEWEISKTRQQELTGQLEKLRETARRAEQKAALEARAKSALAEITRLAAEVDRWQLSQRILRESIHVSEVTVAPVRAR
jgi:hypothetical protein